MYSDNNADNSANIISLSNAANNGEFKVANLSGGQADMTVSNQWYKRPVDERYLNLDDLYNATHQRAADAKQIVVRAGMIDFESTGNDSFVINGIDDNSTYCNHWSFGQICSMSRTPAKYLRTLPTDLAEKCLRSSWARTIGTRDQVMFYKSSANEKNNLYAATSPTYGRIHDYKVVDAVRTIAGSGRGETNWKVPGRMDWSTGIYNPNIEPTVESTTLYASDRDVFMFLVDDTRPIEIGKTPNGDPDIVFRGFYVSNSEVGKSSLEISTFIMRAVCENRIIWGQEELQKISIRHTRNAPNRFLNELRPALRRYAMASEHNVKFGIENAIRHVVADTPEKRESFLTRRGFTKSEAGKIVKAVRTEERKEPSTVWDFIQGITAVAREIENTDTRVKLERRAGDLMKIAA